VVALILMGANGPGPGRARPEPEQAQFAYAFTDLADAQAALTALHQIQHRAGHKLAGARAVAVSYDSVAVAVRVAPARAVRAVVKR
jgi:hypothetical protein